MKKNFRKNIIYSSIIVTIFTIIIKLIGLLKHTAIASHIGASYETDAFYVATGVIGHLSLLIFSALSISLLSLYSEKKEHEGKESANNLISLVFKVFIPISIFISLAVYFFAPIIAHVLAPSYEGEALGTLIHYVKIMSFAFIPCCYYLIANVILEEEKIFIPGRCRDFFQNLFVLIAVLFLYNKFGLAVLVYAFLFASIAEAILITFKIKKYYSFKILESSDYTLIKRLLIISLPLLIGNAVYEINDIVDKQISTGLGSGLASLLTYGATLNEIVTGVIISSISVVLFANFTSHVAKKEYSKIEEELSLVMDVFVMILIPLMIIFIIDGYDITKLFFGRGNLNDSNLTNIYYVLIGYSIGFIFQAFRANLIKVLYSFQQTKSTMYNGIISIIINIALSIILSKFLGLWGVSLATSLSMFMATILAYKDVKKILPNLKIKNITKEYYKYVISGFITTLIILLVHKYLHFNYFINIIIQGMITFVVYFIMVILMKELLGIKMPLGS